MLAADPFRDQPTLTGSHVSEPPADPVVVREKALAWLGSRPDQHDRADWAILRNTDGRFVGEVVFNEFDQDNESVNFRIMLGPAQHFGHGYGSQATRLVIDYALNVVGVHRISLDVYAFNPRARRVYEKCGFQVEGVRRDALRWGDEWIDATSMSIVAG